MGKIAFVSTLWRDRFVEEIGVGYLKAILEKESDHEVRIFYKYPSQNYSDFYEEVISYRPDLVGFTLSHKHTGLKPLYAGAKILKEKLNKVHIVLGGVFATFNAENILNKIKEVDSVLIGECENNIVEFADAVTSHKSISDIDGIVFRSKDGKIKMNSKTQYILNLDQLPFASRPYMDEEFFKNSIFKSCNMVGSRGCHGKCHFCNVPTMYKTYGEDLKWRGRSITNIVDEIEHLNKNYKVLIFNFVDSSFEDCTPLTAGKQRLADLANEIIKRDLKIFYSCCFRAETFKNNRQDKELIELLVKSGLYNILVGVEAGNEKALNEFSKRATLEDNYSAIKVFSEYPVYISKGFMMFTPYSTAETLEKNLIFAHEIGLDEELIYLTTITAVFDNTPFVLDLMSHNLLEKDYNWEDEYPFSWIDENAKKLANEILKIREEYMPELEYTQYYGRNLIILKRISDGSLWHEFAYMEHKVRELRQKIAKNNYAFISKCLDLVRGEWNQETYNLLKEEYINSGFINIYREMVLQAKKFSRLLKNRNTSIQELVKKFMDGVN